MGKKDQSAGEVPKAYVVVKNGFTLSEEDVIKFSEQKLSPFKKLCLLMRCLKHR
ncbi:hypothetical protein ACFLXC_05845 [Chloroflexota bacterium]